MPVAQPPPGTAGSAGPSATLSSSVRIDIWSDVICPWCYLGKRRFERALRLLPFGDGVDVHWRAYRLDPRATAEPGDLRSAIERKYGPGAFDQMTARLGALGPDEGIEFRFDRAQRVSTYDAHRLLAWAAETDLSAQNHLADLLFRAYFEDGENVADRTTLTAAAVAAGLDGDRAAEILDGGEYADAVADDLQAAVERQVTGVPAFFVGESLFIPGAQEVETMAALLTRAHERFGSATA